MLRLHAYILRCLHLLAYILIWLSLHILIVVLVSPLGEVTDLELPSLFIRVVIQMLAVAPGSQIFYKAGFFLGTSLVNFAFDVVERDYCWLVKFFADLWLTVFVAQIVIDLNTALNDCNDVS